MPKRKRSLVPQDGDENYCPPRITRASLREMLMSQRNQITDQINESPLATVTEQDSMSVITENRQKSISNITATNNEMNSNYVEKSVVSSTSHTATSPMSDPIVHEQPHDLSLKMTKKDNNLEDTEQEINIAMKPSKVLNNESSSDSRSKSPITNVETESIRTSMLKSSYVCLPRVKMLNNEIKSEAKMENNSPNPETNSMLETVKLEENFNNSCEKNPVATELIGTENRLESLAEDPEIEIDPVSTMLKPGTECECELDLRNPKALQKEVAKTENLMCESKDVSFGRLHDTNSISCTGETKSIITHKSEDPTQSQVISPANLTHDTVLITEVLPQSESESGLGNEKMKLTCKLSEESLQVIEHNSGKNSNESPSDTLLEIASSAEIVKLEPNALLENEETSLLDANVKPETIAISHYPVSKAEPLTTVTQSADFLLGTIKVRRKRGRPRLNSESKEGKLVPPACESHCTNSLPNIQIDSKLEIPKPKRQQECERPVKLSQILNESEKIEININADSTNDNKLLVNEVQSDLSAENPKPKRQRASRSQGKVPQNKIGLETTKSHGDFLVPTVPIDLTLETLKPKRQRQRKSRAKVPEISTKLEQLDGNINPESESDDKLLLNKVQTDLLGENPVPKRQSISGSQGKVPTQEIGSDTTKSHDDLRVLEVPDSKLEIPKPKRQRQRKSRAKVPEIPIKLEQLDANINRESESDDKLLLNKVQTDLLGENPIRKRQSISGSQGKVPTQEIGLDTTKSHDDLRVLEVPDSKLEISKPKRQRQRKSRAKVPEIPIKLEQLDASINRESESNDKLLLNKVQTDLLGENPIPKRQSISGNQGKVPTQEIGLETTKNHDNLRMLEVPDSKLEIPKPKRQRQRKSCAKVPEIPIKLEQLDANINRESESDDKLLLNKVQTDLLGENPIPKRQSVSGSQRKVPTQEIGLETTKSHDNLRVLEVPDSKLEIPKPKRQRQRKSRAKVPEIPIKSEQLDGNINPESKIYDKFLATEPIHLMATAMEPKIKLVYESEATIPGKMSEVENTEINNDPESQHLKRYVECMYLSPETSNQKDNPDHISKEILRDTELETNLVITEPVKKDVENIGGENSSSKNCSSHNSFPEILENKYLLLEKMYQPKVVLQNVVHSNKLSPQQKKMLLEYNKPQAQFNWANSFHSSINKKTSEQTLTHNVNNKQAKENEDKTSSAKEVESQKKKIKKPQSESMKTSKQRTSSIKKRIKPVYNSSSETHFDSQMTPKQGSSNQDKVFPKQLTASIVLPATEFGTSSISDSLNSESPLDLSIRSSNLLTSDQSVFANSVDTLIGDACFKTNVREIGFGCSVFNLTDLNTSFTMGNIDNSVLTKSKDSDCQSKTEYNNNTQIVEDNQFGGETITMYKASEITEEVCPAMIKTVSNRVTTQVKPEPEEFSIKVSLPAKHYFNKHLVKSMELDKDATQKKVVRTKAQTKLYIDCKSNHQNSKKRTKLTPGKISSQSNSRGVKSKTSTRGNVRKQDKITMSNTRIVDKTDIKISKPMANCAADIKVAVTEAVSAKSPIQQTIEVTNVRSLPKIVTDEILPKGTITFTPIISTSETLMNMETSRVQKICEMKVEKEVTHYRIDVDNIDNSGKLNKIGKQRSLPSSTLPQLSLSSQSVPDNVQPQSMEQGSVAKEHFDSTPLWKICPELESFLSNEDTVNNNAENTLKIETFNDTETNYDTNQVDEFPTPMETASDVENTEKLSTNYVTDAKDDMQNLHYDITKGVVATKTDYIEIEEDFSIPINESKGMVDSEADYNDIKAEPIATQSQLNLVKTAVLADLTTDNLRNFNNISNCTDEAGLNWSVDMCEYFLSCGDVAPLSDRCLPGVAIDDICKSKAPMAEDQKDISGGECKKRKRRWVQDQTDTCIKPVENKKLKLNRNTWSIESQDCGISSNTQRHTSQESVSSANSLIANFGQSTPKTTTTETKVNTITGTTNEPPNLHEEEIESRQIRYECKAQELSQWNMDGTEPTEKKNDLTEITIHSESKIAGSHRGLDQNGNLTSSSSSSSSSGRRAATNINSEDVGTPTVTNNQNDSYNEELDADCISLYAASMFSDIELDTNLAEGSGVSPSFSPRYKGPAESEGKFSYMDDAFIEKNKQECSAAYDSCVQEDRSLRNTSENILQNSFNTNHNRIPIMETSIKQPSLVNQESGQMCPPAKITHCSSLSRDMIQPISNLNDYFSDIEIRFRGHCFNKLKTGCCPRIKCYYYHDLRNGLDAVCKQIPDFIEIVLEYAIARDYAYFIRYQYCEIVTQVDYIHIIKFFFKVAHADLMDSYLVKRTFEGTQKYNKKRADFIKDVISLINEHNDNEAQLILRIFEGVVEIGSFWDTFRDLFIKMKPVEAQTVNRIIEECVKYRKEELHVKDVYLNCVRKLTTDEASSININLKRDFDALLTEYNVIYQKEKNVDRKVDAKNWWELNMFDNHGTVQIPSILSPDDTAQYNSVTVSHFPTRSKEPIPNSSCPETDAVRILKQNIESIDPKINQNLLNQRKGIETQKSSATREISTDVNVNATSEPNTRDVPSIPWKLYPIDDLKPARTAFPGRYWLIHMSMHNLKVCLKYKQYLMALRILNSFSDRGKTLYMTYCYNMLRAKVMESAVHVKNMIKLSVLMGDNNSLTETLFILGMYITIELCNNNAWALAYRLFKCLPKSPSLMDNNAEYYLISAEIYLANRRPLQAFTVLKQNNMLSDNRSKWNVVSNPNDEHVRVMIINLILDVLCQDYPDDALYAFESILRDQTRIYHPVDLTAHVDNLVMCISTGKCNVPVTRIATRIIENNFILKNSVFRSLVVKVFHEDITLCKRLYCYGTCIGIYPMAQLTLPLHILIRTDWKKEEMYLVIMDFLEKLSMDIGPAIGSIGPNQLTIHLVFELAPFKEQNASYNNGETSNIEELKLSKETMKTVLREQFDPPIRTIIAERERFIKLQCRSVVNYLKSMTQ